MKSLAPIVLFVYNRPDHTLKTLEALANNSLAKKSTLYIYADGAKDGASEQTLNSIAQTREVIRLKQWCKEVQIIESEVNKGLADSIVQGVTLIIEQYGKIIVLEDDIVTSPHFLTFMNDSLDVYENTEEVMHISGYFPITNGVNQLPDYFFVRYMYCWGWATWKRAWKHFSTDTQMLHNALLSRTDFNEFDIDGSIKSFEQIELNLKGTLKTWAVKWYATIFINDGLCLTPKHSLVDNIGIDGSGENCHSHDDRWRVRSFKEALDIQKLSTFEENKKAREYLKRFNKYGSNSSLIGKLSKKMTQIRYLTIKEVFFITLQKLEKAIK